MCVTHTHIYKYHKKKIVYTIRKSLLAAPANILIISISILNHDVTHFYTLYEGYCYNRLSFHVKEMAPRKHTTPKVFRSATKKKKPNTTYEGDVKTTEKEFMFFII